MEDKRSKVYLMRSFTAVKEFPLIHKAAQENPHDFNFMAMSRVLGFKVVDTLTKDVANISYH